MTTSPTTPAASQALAAPLDEVADRDLLVERGDDDGELGLDDVVVEARGDEPRDRRRL